MQAMLTVMMKVAVVLILIVVGVIVARAGILTEKGAAEITTLLLKLVTPCVIVNSLINAGELKVSEMLAATGLAAVAMLVAIAIAYCFYRREPLDRRTVLRFSVIYSNTGFMGLPLVQGILGARGVVFASFFVVVFNIICWTHGYVMMNGGSPGSGSTERKLNIKTALLNPGVIGLAIGLPLYFLKIRLPAVVAEPLGFLSDLNTPLGMLIVGSHIARVDFKSFISDLSVYKVSLLRLVLAPAVYVALLLVLRPIPELFISTTIQAAAPVAANTVLFAVEFHRDSQLASKTVAVSTALSVLTIPLFTAAAQLLSSL